jgi:hypothetical protein
MEAMTTRNDKERNPLVRLADSLTDDIMKASDEQILAEFNETGRDPVANASKMRAFVDKAIITSNKGRLAAAKAGIAAARKPLRQVTVLVDIAEARRRLRSIGKIPNVQHPVTLAARNETELSDADVFTMYEDMVELGLLPTDDSKDSKT